MFLVYSIGKILLNNIEEVSLTQLVRVGCVVVHSNHRIQIHSSSSSNLGSHFFFLMKICHVFLHNNVANVQAHGGICKVLTLGNRGHESQSKKTLKVTNARRNTFASPTTGRQPNVNARQI
jgi:hypothetical protein